MCGICGITGERAEAAEPVLESMLAALRHRGPDGSGRLSMAHSLEVRVPLLDPELAEYVVALPETRKCRRGARKPPLADALGELLPRKVVAQPKRTFTLLVLNSWVRHYLDDSNRIDEAPAQPAQGIGGRR